MYDILIYKIQHLIDLIFRSTTGSELSYESDWSIDSNGNQIPCRFYAQPRYIFYYFNWINNL
jgi:hypothetical protein